MVGGRLPGPQARSPRRREDKTQTPERLFRRRRDFLEERMAARPIVTMMAAPYVLRSGRRQARIVADDLGAVRCEESLTCVRRAATRHVQIAVLREQVAFAVDYDDAVVELVADNDPSADPFDRL